MRRENTRLSFIIKPVSYQVFEKQLQKTDLAAGYILNFYLFDI